MINIEKLIQTWKSVFTVWDLKNICKTKTHKWTNLKNII